MRKRIKKRDEMRERKQKRGEKPEIFIHKSLDPLLQ